MFLMETSFVNLKDIFTKISWVTCPLVPTLCHLSVTIEHGAGNRFVRSQRRNADIKHIYFLFRISYDKVLEAARFVENKLTSNDIIFNPTVGVICGTGLSKFSHCCTDTESGKDIFYLQAS